VCSGFPKRSCSNKKTDWDYDSKKRHPDLARAGDCFAPGRKDALARKAATKWHDGQITKSLSSPSDKNILVAASGKSGV
jgi:hypothetical protein